MEEKKGAKPLQPTRTRRTRLAQHLRWIARDHKKLLDHFPQLSFTDQLGILLFTSGTLRQELIIASPHAETLVRALPEPEVYVTLKEIGIPDAHPLLSLMTPAQIQYVADLEVWKKGTLEPARVIDFLEHLYACGEDTFARWIETTDPELIVRILHEYGSVDKFDMFKDPTEQTETYYSGISYDGYYFFYPKVEALRPLFDALLRITSTRNPSLYATLLESAYQDLSTEVEEEAAKYRNARLAEKGIPPFDEACEIYRYLSDEEFFSCALTVPSPDPHAIPSPLLYPVRWLSKDSMIREVMRVLEDGPHVDRIRFELASLANKVVIADGLDVTSVEVLKAALGKVAGYIGIALSYLSGGNTKDAAAWMARTWAHFLFRLGYSQIVKLVRRARRLAPSVSFRWIDRTIYLLDTPMEEILRGLLRARPLFFEGQHSENFLGYRDFASLQDVTHVEHCLTGIERLESYFSNVLLLPPEVIKTHCLEAGMAEVLDEVKWTKVLATLWVYWVLYGSSVFRPLHAEEVRTFRQTVAASRPGALVQTTQSRSFLTWLERSIPEGCDKERTKQVIVQAFQRAVRDLEEDLQGLDVAMPIDHRFVKSLCIAVPVRGGVPIDLQSRE